jgi:hypothetical protein
MATHQIRRPPSGAQPPPRRRIPDIHAEAALRSSPSWAERASPLTVCHRMGAAVEFAGQVLGIDHAAYRSAATLPMRGTLLIQILEDMTDGVTLCRLVNAIAPGSVPVVSETAPRAERRKLNIPALSLALRDIGIPEALCLTVRECSPGVGGMMTGRHTRGPSTN